MQASARYSEIDDAVRRGLNGAKTGGMDIIKNLFASQHADEAEAGKLETEYIAEWWAFPPIPTPAPAPALALNSNQDTESLMYDLAIRALTSLHNPDGSKPIDLVKWIYDHAPADGSLPTDTKVFRHLAASVFAALLESGEVVRVGHSGFKLAAENAGGEEVQAGLKRRAVDVLHGGIKRLKPSSAEGAEEFETVGDFVAGSGSRLPAPLPEFLESWTEEENADHE